MTFADFVGRLNKITTSAYLNYLDTILCPENYSITLISLDPRFDLKINFK